MPKILIIANASRRLTAALLAYCIDKELYKAIDYLREQVRVVCGSFSEGFQDPFCSILRCCCGPIGR